MKEQQSPDTTPPVLRPGATLDEISLHAGVRRLRQGWKVLLATTLAGLAIGGGYGMLAPERFEASASIQVAMVGNEPVETPGTLAEKLKMAPYYSEGMLEACGLSKLENPREQLARKLRPTVNRVAPMVGVRFEHPTPEGAEKCLSTLVNFVRGNQAVLAEPMLKTKSDQLAALKERLKEVEDLKTALSDKTSGRGANGLQGGESALVLAALASANQEIRQLISEIGKLQISLSIAHTRPAVLVAPIYVEEMLPASKRLLVAVAASFAGFMFGLLVLIARKAWGPN